MVTSITSISRTSTSAETILASGSSNVKITNCAGLYDITYKFDFKYNLNIIKIDLRNIQLFHLGISIV